MVIQGSRPSFLSSWASAISPSPTLMVDARAKALQSEGKDVCGFGAGEPDFDTPDFIKEAAIQALRDGKTKYAPGPGIPPLRDALAEKYRRHNGLAWAKASNTVVSPGGKFSCYLALLAVCSPGDEVIIPAPFWVSYPEMVKLTGATPVIVSAGMETDFKITPDQLKAALTLKTRCIILNSPSNPTGAVYSREELTELAEICFKAGVYVMSDEIYEHLIYDGGHPFSPASLGDEGRRWVITVSGFSKSYSMTGWRLGTLIADDPIAKAVSDLQSQTTSNATTFAQYGALAALKEEEKAFAAMAEMKVAFDQRRLYLVNALNQIEGITCPLARGAFYVFPSIVETGLSADDFAARILEEELVAVVSGEGFGAPGHIRLSYAVGQDVLEKGVERITRFCQRVKAATS